MSANPTAIVSLADVDATVVVAFLMTETLGVTMKTSKAISAVAHVLTMGGAWAMSNIFRSAKTANGTVIVRLAGTSAKVTVAILNIKILTAIKRAAKARIPVARLVTISAE